MKLRLSLAVLVIGAVRVVGQQPANQPSVPTIPSAPRAFFELAVPHYDFSDPKLKPWHLKASYEIYDYEGKLAAKGTWEYWWASPKVRRRTWERPGFSRTDWINGDGTIYSKENGDGPLYFERRLEDIILYPGPNYEKIAAGKLKLELKPGKGPTSPDCLNAIPLDSSTGTPHVVTQASQVQYCFDPETKALMTVSSEYGRSKYGKFVVMQDHYIARQIAVQIDFQATLYISIDSIDGIESTDPALVRSSDSAKLPELAHYTSDSPAPATVSGGKLLKEVKAQVLSGDPHMHGIVLVSAAIGKDGTVRRVEILRTPSKMLADAVADAVKKWVYEPFTVNDEPIEAQVSIQMHM